MMKFLIDTSPAKLRTLESPLIGGQLLTPLTSYANSGSKFAIDNGAFSRFDAQGFQRLLEREAGNKDRCLFVTVPDIVGNCRRTLEIWRYRHRWVDKWPMALVAQDGAEDMDIPWSDFKCLFIGGRDPWKDSQVVADLVKTAKILGKHVHVGRVNTPKRFIHFTKLGADTCDGSGVAMYDHMLEKIEQAVGFEMNTLRLFDQEVA